MYYAEHGIGTINELFTNYESNLEDEYLYLYFLLICMNRLILGIVIWQ